MDTPSNFSTPHSKFERNHFKRSQNNYTTSKVGLVSLGFFFLIFFLFLQTYKNCYKTRTPYLITLTFGTQKQGIKAHLCTNFGWNTINRQRVTSDYSGKITPILCCHAYRVNRLWEEAENQWVNRLGIEPQTFCGLKEIELKTRKIQHNYAIEIS